VKRITISIEDNVLKWLDEQIKKSNFYNYQHVVEFCLKNLSKNNCVFLEEEMAEVIDKIINSGKVPYYDRQSFIFGCIKQQAQNLST